MITRIPVVALVTLVLLVPMLAAHADVPFAECFPASALDDEWLAYTLVDGEVDPASAVPMSANTKTFWFGLDGEPLRWLGDGSDIPEGKMHVFGVNFGYRGMPAAAQQVGLLASKGAAVWIFLAPDNGDDLWLILFTPEGMCGGYYVSLGHQSFQQTPQHHPAS